MRLLQPIGSLAPALALALIWGALGPVPTTAQDAERSRPPEKWIPLFNGKDLSGWTPKFSGQPLGENFRNTFRVKDGVLQVSYDEWESFDNTFGHLFHEKEFSNYRLRAEYRFVGDQLKGGPGWAFRNNGLMVHGQKPESMTLKQNFPVSIEVQLLGGREKGKRSTGNLCTPGTHVVLNGKLDTRHCISSKSKTCRGDDWVTVEVVVKGNRIRHLIDGVEVLAYEDAQLDPKDDHGKRLLEAGHPKLLTRGTISIQAETHPTEFRKIEILELE